MPLESKYDLISSTVLEAVGFASFIDWTTLDSSLGVVLSPPPSVVVDGVVIFPRYYCLLHQQF